MVRGGPKLDRGRRRELGQSFQDGGKHYDRVRPGYPAESARWLVPAGAHDALDVGAGTGKFTDLLLALGLSVTAVDPSADMLAQLSGQYPAVAALRGTAEATGLDDASFDVVSVAQAARELWPRRIVTKSPARPSQTIAAYARLGTQ